MQPTIFVPNAERNMDKQIGGVLYTADFSDCKNLHTLTIGHWFETALIKAGANIVPKTWVEHTFPNGAVSMTAILQESHAAIHTWPEGNFVTFELFTCGETVNALAAINYLADRLECIKYGTNRHSRFPENATITR